jgi:F0F1-type ATP synthase assembly protein I
LENIEKEKEPKYKKVVVAVDGLSLGISIVVAIVLGVLIGIFLKNMFGLWWLFWLGVFWGVGGAILNIYKAYKRQKASLDELANDPKYRYKKFDDSDDDDEFSKNY